MPAKKYPVKIRLDQHEHPTKSGTAPTLQTYIEDWVTIEEFEALKPGSDITKYMSYPSVGPEHWTIHITPDEVLNCERERAVQGIYINAILRKYLKQPEKSPDEMQKITRGYGEIGPDAVLFLMQLHEMINEPVDNFGPPAPLDDEMTLRAVDLMVQEGVTLPDLMKTTDQNPQE